VSDPAVPSTSIPRSRRVAIGCFTFVLGGMSGAMVAVLLSKFIAFLTRAESCPGIPTCNWYVYAGVGALLGSVSLSGLVVWTISKPTPAPPAQPTE
jgi:hypothetical protein